MSPSPRAHLHRLLVLLALGFVAFLGIKEVMTPASWDFEKWYRTDALPLLQEQPLTFGGNQSCDGASCHEDERFLIEDAKVEHKLRLKWLGWATHKTLSCESCHGPLADHVKDGLKTEKAVIERESSLCLRCHAKRLGRNAVAHFSESYELHKLLDVTRDSTCVECHNPHEPR